MKPIIKIDINQAIANTRFIQDLSTVLYGAEVALKRVDASDSQISKVLNDIVYSAFSALEFNFDYALTARPGNEPQPEAYESYRPAPGENAPLYTNMPGAYSSVAASDIDYDFFDENPLKSADQSHLYKMSDKTYDSRMDDDEDLERRVGPPAQNK